MASKRLSIMLIVLIALLSSESSMARNGGGFRGGQVGPGFRGGHAGPGFRSGHLGGGFRGRHVSPGFRGGHIGGGFGERHIRPGFKGGHIGGGFRGRYFRDDHFRGFGHRAHSGFGFFVGDPFFWPSYPRYYSSPALILRSVPPVYIEQSTVTKVQSLESSGWNYCPSLKGYYPHVKECPTAWLKIESQPSGLESGYWYYCADPVGYYPYIRVCSAMWQKVVP